MRNLECNIEKTVNALEQAIENRKIQMQNARSQVSASPVISHLFLELLNRAGGSYGQMTQVFEKGTGQAQEFLKRVQQHVEEKPWEALRKVAVFSFGIGLFLSRRHRKLPIGEKE